MRSTWPEEAVTTSFGFAASENKLQLLERCLDYTREVKLLSATVLLAFGSLTALAQADDGWVGFGGNPKLMTREHPQIRMVSETVDLRVVGANVVVDCTFHFKNE